VVEDGCLPDMEPTERAGSKVYGPDVIGDLFETNAITSD